MKRSLKYHLWFIVLLCWNCSKAEGTDQVNKIIRLLFIGNSLTYTNDVPALVKELGKNDSIRIQYKTMAYPDYGLDDHLADGKVQEEIRTGNYTYVIIQQGPSALPASQVALMSSVKRFQELCAQTNQTKLVLYMVWPSKARLFDLDNVIHSYTEAAVKNGAVICSVGLAWKKTWQVEPSISLYGIDGFHPDIIGSLLAAMTIYGKLIRKTGVENISSKKSSWKREVSTETLNILKASAIAAIDAK